MNKTKPYRISKQLVFEAYKRVKANRGAEGVDRQTMQNFEGNLKDNLYKLWNRMSSGSYFPPPVKAVSIPKKIKQKIKGQHKIYRQFQDILFYCPIVTQK